MRKKILVVDDDSVTRKFLAFLLKTEGFEIIPAQDGMEGLEKLAEQNFDLVITDLNMPRMDGVEFIRNIRENSETSDLSVILLTTEADDETRKIGLQAGASEYMTKPVTKELLIKRVREWTGAGDPVASGTGGSDNEN